MYQFIDNCDSISIWKELKWDSSRKQCFCSSLCLCHAGTVSHIERWPAAAGILWGQRELIKLTSSLHSRRLVSGSLLVVGSTNSVGLVVWMWNRPVANRVIVTEVALHLSDCLSVRSISAIIHLLQAHEKLADNFLVLVSLASVACTTRSLPLAWAWAVLLLRCLLIVSLLLQLIKSLKKCSLLELIEFLQKQIACLISQLLVIGLNGFGLVLRRWHQVSCIHKFLIVHWSRVRIVLSLIHLELIWALLLIQLARYWVSFRWLHLLFGSAHIWSQIIVKKTARTFGLDALRGQLF